MDRVKGSLFAASVLLSCCAQAQQAPREAERLDREKKFTPTPHQAPFGTGESTKVLSELLATVKLQTEAITQLKAKVDQLESRLSDLEGRRGR